MPLQPRNLKIPNLPFSGGELQSIEMPLTVYRGLQFRIVLNHTNVTATAFNLENFLKILPSFAINIDGQDTTIRMSATDLYIMNRYDYSQEPIQVIDTADGAKTSYVDMFIPFELTRAVNPQDTIFDARKFKSVRLEATWGTEAVVATSGVTITSGYIQLDSDEYAQVPSDLPTGRHEINAIEWPLNTIGDIRHELPVGSNHQYRRMYIQTRDSVGNLTSGLIGNIDLSARSFTYVKKQADAIQRHNTREFSTTPYGGTYILELIRGGLNTQRIDAGNLTELTLTVDSLVNNGTLRLVMDKAIFLV